MSRARSEVSAEGDETILVAAQYLERFRTDRLVTGPVAHDGHSLGYHGRNGVCPDIPRCTVVDGVFFDIATEAGGRVAEFHLSLGPFRQVVKDYFQICESYFDAVKRLPPAQIEAIDMARRGIHNEGARVVQERLDGKALLDIDTARRLFTLICVLQTGG